MSYSKSEESLTTENLADIPNGKFQFKSQLGGQVGNSIRRKSGGNSVDCDRGNPSKSNTSPGVVQSQAMEAWKWIFPLTPMSMKTGCLPLTNSSWGLMENPWWSHLFDTPELEEVRRIVWETIPQIHLALLLCEVEPELSLMARRMLENQPIATAFMGNRHALKILECFNQFRCSIPTSSPERRR